MQKIKKVSFICWGSQEDKTTVCKTVIVGSIPTSSFDYAPLARVGKAVDCNVTQWVATPLS